MRDNYGPARRRMVETQLLTRDITDQRVIEAMLRVPRHLFVDEALGNQAYSDRPLQIGEYQTISQPYMVALMSQELALGNDARVLEIGTGSGYQAAILAELCEEVFSVERIQNLHTRARQLLNRLGYGRVRTKLGDGTLGWAEHGPFDGIIVTAGAPETPDSLKEQLAPGGRLVIPVGDREVQMLKVITKTRTGFETRGTTPCRFVNLIGEEGWR